MDKEIRLYMTIDGDEEAVSVPSLYDAGFHAASFIRNLDLDKHVDADIRIEIAIAEKARDSSESEF